MEGKNELFKKNTNATKKEKSRIIKVIIKILKCPEKRKNCYLNLKK